MADRVHPITTTDATVATKTTTKDDVIVIQIPKDQIYKIPPPENAYHFRKYTARASRRRNSCRTILCWSIGILSLILLLLAAGAGLFYLIVRPQSPRYSLDTFSVTTTSSSSSFSSQFDLSVRSNNPNKKIGIYYRKGSSCAVYYANVKLSDGAVPVFYQPSTNVTVFPITLKSSGVALGTSLNQSLVNQQNQGKILFDLKLRLPVRLKVGSVKTWTITVKVSCQVTVDKLTAGSKIVSKDCRFNVKPW